MIKSIISGILVLIAVAATAQVQTQVIGDSIHMHSNAATAELILENSTQNVNGFLYNKGNGRTEFRRGSIKLNDSMYLIGADTLRISSLVTLAAQNGLLYNSLDKKIEFGNGFFDEYGPAVQNRATIYSQNSNYFNWTTGSNGIFTVSKYKYGTSATETNPLSSYYLARFAHQAQGQGGILLENSFKGPSVWAFPQMWINFKNTHTDAKKYSFYGDSIAASIQNGTRTGVDNKVYSILDLGSASDTTSYGYSILKLFPAFTAASGGPIRVPTASVKRLDISNEVGGAMYNLTSLSYNNPYSRLVIDAYNQPLVLANLPTGNGYALVVDSTGKVWRNENSSSSYSLPIASPAVLGGIKVGANLSIDAGGVLSATGGSSMAIGGAITGSPNEKSLLFVGAGGVLAQNTNLIFDNTNNYLGINMGSVAPTDFLQVGGTTGSIQFGGANGRTITARNAANDGKSNFDFIANSVSFDSKLEILSIGGVSGHIQLYEGTAGTTTDGALEHIDDNINFTSGTTRYVIPKTLVASATLDFPNTTSANVADLTITVNGAALGDAVSLGIPAASVTPTATFSAWVSAANTVKIRFSPKATEDPASGAFKVSVIK